MAFADTHQTRPHPNARRTSGNHHYAALAAEVAFQCWSAADGVVAYEDSWRARSANKVQVSTADEWQRFQSLAENWRKERGITSSVTQMVLCPSYQRIMVMGERVVPFILRELENNRHDPDHWFWALEMITEADPVPVEAYGDTVRMADAWLSWAEGRYDW